ncbi:MAG: PLP-dependent transferase [Bacteriovoracaceae bacterium]|nr:PLP-dependent transferase [Bacteriovoracaceae bacterium]
MKKKSWSFATKAIHIGGKPDKETGAIMPPIYQTSTYVQESPGKHKGYEYSRTHNPTRTRLEECLASLENAQFAVTTSSGMSAIMLMMHLIPQGSTILCSDDVYGGTFRLFTTVFKDFHTFIFTDTSDTAVVGKLLQKHKPKLLWIESPTNPLLKISDIKTLTGLAKKNKTLTLVDNTFASPYFQNPLDQGADFVMHSMTKYLGGHSDVIGGVLMLNDEKNKSELSRLQNSIGPCLAPFDSWLILRGLKTLSVRMQAHEKNAKVIAKYLEQHPKVEKVLYPGLKSHPQHNLAKKQMHGFSGIITFFVKGGLKESKKFLENVKLFALAESLGGVESLVDHPAIMTHASIPKANRIQLGITDNLIRLSVGIEDIDDLLQDLETALNKV